MVVIDSPANLIKGDLLVEGNILGSSVGTTGGIKKAVDLEDLDTRFDAHVLLYTNHVHSNGNNGGDTGIPK